MRWSPKTRRRSLRRKMPDKRRSRLRLKPAALKIPTAAAPPAGASTIADMRRMWAAEFRAGGIDSAELDARVLVGHALGLDHAALTARGEQSVSGQQRHAI